MNLPDGVLTMAHSIRRGLLGTVNEAEAPVSKWNGSVVRKKCTKCDAEVVRDLEVHHINERSRADSHGRFAGGSAQDHIRNLVVLCAKCHDAVHAGAVTLGPMVQSSKGPVRLDEDPVEEVVQSGPRSKWSAEQVVCIRDYLKMYPNVLPKRAVFDLKEKGIDISVTSLRAFRNLP